MARHKLTDTRVKAAKTGWHGDGDGLWLRVHASGSKNWVFVFKKDGKRTELGLGGYGRGTSPVSLAVARDKAGAIREQLAVGIDPRATKKPSAPNKPKTFKDCMTLVLEAKDKELGNAKHRAQWRMVLTNYAADLHDLPVAEIGIGAVKACLEKHWEERPETADRLRSRIQAVIDYAIAHEWRTKPNPAVWRGRLEKVMPARQKLTRGHHAALPYKVAPAAAARLRSSKGTAARAVEFVALTAARTGEARGATWAEIDFNEAVWTVPAERMKAGAAHRVPLSSRAIDILRDMHARRFGQYVFAGERDGTAVSDTAMTKALKLAAPDAKATLHGWRSCFRDWAGDCTTHPRDVAEAALAHTLQGVEAAYRRGDALAKRRQLMEDWSAYLAG